ncbi:MAG: helix-turn-helix domain-containing protein [Anaerolineae bacterium]|nr:helix-turn-helix domain-containing protein [Anaerolineae bacterium]
MRDRLLTVKEVAGYFHVSTATIQRWCRSGRLPVVRIGHEWRVDGERLQAMIQQEGPSLQRSGGSLAPDGQE